MPHGEAFHRFKIQPQFLSKSVTCGLTIFARFARTDVNALAIVHLYFNGLVATVATNVKTHIVTAFFQFADDFVWNSTLDFNVTAARHFSPVGSLSPSCCQREASPASCTFKPNRSRS